MTPHQLDSTILMLAVLLPIWIILRSDFRGVLVAALIPWGLLVVAGWVLSATVPDRGFNLDAVWLLFGWFPSLIYCLAIYGVKILSIHVFRKIAILLKTP